MEVLVSTGEYGEHLVTSGDEQVIATKFKYYPMVPITIVKARIDMKDDYNGKVTIELSNTHTVIYECVEIRGNCGPDTRMSVTVDRPSEVSYKICGNEFGEDYLGNKNTWIECVMDCYMDYHGKK